MARGFCPECDAEVGLGKTPKVGQKVTCSSCGAYLELVDLTPIELDWAYEDEDEFEFDEEMDEEEEY